MHNQPNIQAGVNLGVKGHFHLTAINSETGTERELADFDNLIVNAGLDMIAVIPSGYDTPRGGCSVGTGNTPAAAGDTVMEAFLAGTDNVLSTTFASNLTTTPYYADSIYTYQFATGVAAGNLTEIGIVATNSATPTSSAPLFAHSLILDSMGNPTTITILSNEILNVVYTFRVLVPDTDITGTFTLTIDGTDTSFSYTIRPSEVSGVTVGLDWWFGPSTILGTYRQGTNWNSECFQGFAFGPLSGDPTYSHDSFISPGNESLQSYTTGTYTIANTVLWTLTQGNFTPGIDGFQWGMYPLVWQMSVSPDIAKNSNQQLTMHFSVSWTRGT